MSARSVRFALALLAVSIWACDDPADPGYSGPSGPVAVQSVRVAPLSVQLVIGQTKQLAMVITPSNATDQAVTWESTDTTVATVDDGGLVTARAEGVGVFVTAYAHDGPAQSSSNITVVAGPGV